MAVSKTESLAQLARRENLSDIGKKSGLARTVLYRLLDGGGITMTSAVRLSKAYPSLYFKVGRRKIVIREV